MKKVMQACLLVLALAPLVGCSAKTDGKWLDYGDGMVNLTLVNQVTTFSTYEGCSIKFDNVMLPLCPTDYHTAEELRGQLEIDNKKVLQDTLKSISDFLKSNENYKQLETL